MKYLFIILIGIASNFVIGQTTSMEATTAEANPYPVITEQPVSNKAASFIALFNKDVNVGNLHVYSFIEKPNENYYFLGTKIDAGFMDMFSPDLRELRNKKRAEFYAVQAIRGKGNQYYIIRSPGHAGNNRLALYQLTGEKLQLKTELANAKKVDTNISQTDAWIRDIDGNTLLDVILVQVEKEERKTTSSKIVSVMLQNEQGILKEDTELKIDPLVLLTEDL